MINDNIKRYYVLGGFENTKRGIEKENMKEGIIKRNSINDCEY